MRNLKKILALVLALVMTLSVMTVANAAFKDADEVAKSDYNEAIQVLSGLKVFRGDDNGNFNATTPITRAEVAAIIYRIVTGDINDAQVSIYADYNKFTDVKSTAWYAGYVNFCANAEYIKGYGDGTFGPNDQVTGYQALAMILRAIGYDKNGEFTGSNWQVQTAAVGKKLGVTDNITAGTLGTAATREVVAEILFQTLLVPQVEYTVAFGYQNKTISGNGIFNNASLGFETFGLSKGNAANDKWGRPYYSWTATKPAAVKGTVATIYETPVKTYTTAVAECQVAADYGFSKTKAYQDFTLYVNGEKVVGGYRVDSTDTTTKMGAQGRLTEVYGNCIVMIDTFLAKVTNVSEAAYDAAGHLRAPATIVLEVYDAATAPTTSSLTLTNGTTNYTYTKGEYVLLNAYTDAANTATASGKVIVGSGKYGKIVGAATSIVGAQSVLYWNAKQHNVEGTVYDDAYKFLLDEAGRSAVKYTWFFDQYGNLIGATEIATAYTYGVINSIWWAGNTADGSGVAKATVTYMDGTTGSIDLGKITVDTTGTGAAYTAATGTPTYSIIDTDIMTVASNSFYVTTNAATNDAKDTAHGILADNLFRFNTLANGTVAAVEVAGNGTGAGYENLRNVTTTITKNTQVNGTLIVNANTVFLVRSGAGTSVSPYTYKTVTGFTNIDSYVSGEVDYVDVDKNGVADYVYITAENTASRSLNLFYYDGQQGAYALADGTWAVPGYVDGVASTVKFANYAALSTTLETAWSSGVAAGYPQAGQLYAVAIKNGVVVYGAKVVDGGTMSTSVSYNSEIYAMPASVYSNWSDVKIAYVSGAAADTFDGNLFTDADVANVYYSVIDDVTKVVGTMTPIADKNFWFVYKSTGTYNALALQVYAADKDTTASTDPTLYSTVTYSVNVRHIISGDVQTYELGTYKINADQVATGYQWSTCWALFSGADANWTPNAANYAQLVGMGVDGSEAAAPINVNVVKGAAGSYTFYISVC